MVKKIKKVFIKPILLCDGCSWRVGSSSPSGRLGGTI